MFVAHYATTEPPEFKVDGGTLAVVGSGIAQTPERQLRIENDFHQGTVISEIRSPLDLERYNSHNWHGSCHGGDLGPSQSETLRPVPVYAQHRLPIEGLYQTGATTHPSGSVTSGPRRNVAIVLLKDMGRDLNEVINN